ncbi:MAG TPA: hypothetical protein VMU53_18450 [Candidatus Sulfotelmatobacter sp.]|nr:hypothetical protein [Candidatus Sulfotelmatobacter sp.]
MAQTEPPPQVRSGSLTVPRVSRPAQLPSVDAQSVQQQVVRPVWPQQGPAARVAHVAPREPQALAAVPLALLPEQEPPLSVLLAPARARALPVPACLAACAGPSRPPQS